jgi:hypothetical protein
MDSDAPRNQTAPLPDCGDLLNHPDGQRHQHDDERRESDAPTALAPFEGFFGCHDWAAE